jgi:hypothetical protein
MKFHSCRRVAHPLWLDRASQTRVPHPSRPLLARGWELFRDHVMPTLSPKEGDKGGAPAPGQLSVGSEKQVPRLGLKSSVGMTRLCGIAGSIGVLRLSALAQDDKNEVGLKPRNVFDNLHAGLKASTTRARRQLSVDSCQLSVRTTADPSTPAARRRLRSG